MTAEEAKKRIRGIRKCFSGKKNLEVLDKAEEALNKQIPLEVYYIGDGYSDGELVYDMAKCQSCGYVFENGDQDWENCFCHWCGQALKWDTGTISQDE